MTDETTTVDTDDTSTDETEQNKTLLGGDEDAGKVSRDTTDEKDDDKGDESEESKKSDRSDDDKSEDDEEKAGAPDEYSDFTIPEGFEVDDARLATFQEFGQEHGLTQEAAQALVDLHVSAIQEVTDAQAAAFADMKDGWVAEVRADKDLQDDEGKADAAISVAAKAVEALGGDSLKEALNITGAGSHPAVVRAFHEIGKHMVDDKIVFGSGGGGDVKTGAQAMFPTMKQ